MIKTSSSLNPLRKVSHLCFHRYKGTVCFRIWLSARRKPAWPIAATRPQLGIEPWLAHYGKSTSQLLTLLPHTSLTLPWMDWWPSLQPSPTLWFCWRCVTSRPFVFLPSFCSAPSCWPILAPGWLSSLSLSCFLSEKRVPIPRCVPCTSVGVAVGQWSSLLHRTPWQQSAWTGTPLCSFTSSIIRLWRPGEFVQSSPSSGSPRFSLRQHPYGTIPRGWFSGFFWLCLHFPSPLSSMWRFPVPYELRSRSSLLLRTKRSNRQETHWTWRGTGQQRPPGCGYTFFSLSSTSLFLCAASVTAVFGHTVVGRSLREFTYTFLYLNSLLNPIVCCMRLPTIRAEVVKQLRKLPCQPP